MKEIDRIEGNGFTDYFSSWNDWQCTRDAADAV